MDWYPQALIDAGINVTFLEGWENPRNPGYVWREGHPEGAMWHHTATNGYTPNRDKANMWAGLMPDQSNRLYATGGGVPTLTIANSFPAPISSGYGVQALLTDYVRQDIRFLGKQRDRDDYPQWAGNRTYWNTEIVLDGIGTWMDQDVWDMCVEAAAILSNGMGWSAWRHVGHGQHTMRKIDLRDGRFPDMSATMEAFTDDVEGAAVTTHYKIGNEYKTYEEISWLLFIEAGGTVDPNGWASQVQTKLPWKTNVKLVQREDFDMLADMLGMDQAHRETLINGGLYAFGKEMAALRERSYT